MRVYFVENETPNRDSSGGIMTYVINLSNFLREKGFTTILLGSDSNETPNKNNLFSDFTPVVRKINVSNFKYIINLFKIICKLEFDDNTIVHAQRPDMLFPFIVLARAKKSICTLHGAHDLAVFDKKGLFNGYIYSFLQKIAFKKVSFLIAVDKKTKEHYVRKYPFIKHKIDVVPIGVDFEKFKPLEKNELREKYQLGLNDEIILYVGRLEKEKNLSFLIDAFTFIKEKNKGAKLVLVGAGREEAMLREKCKMLNLNSVIFFGEIDNTRIPELMNCADVFAFYSLYEGSPTVIKEALACDLPVVSVEVGDVKEVIENIEGCILSDRNTEDFARNIITALSATNKKKDIRNQIMRFDSKNVGEQIYKYYQVLINK